MITPCLTAITETLELRGGLSLVATQSGHSWRAVLAAKFDFQDHSCISHNTDTNSISVRRVTFSAAHSCGLVQRAVICSYFGRDEILQERPGPRPTDSRINRL